MNSVVIFRFITICIVLTISNCLPCKDPGPPEPATETNCSKFTSKITYEENIPPCKPNCEYIVQILSKKDTPKYHDEGAGIIVGKSDASVFVITADHVIKDKEDSCKRYYIKFFDDTDNEAYIINNILYSEKDGVASSGELFTDLALIEVSKPVFIDNLSKLNYQASYETGQGIVVIGHHGKNWKVRFNNMHFRRNPAVVVLGAGGYDSGHSGGAIYLNPEGHLIGMVTHRSGGRTDDAYGMNISKIVEILKNNGHRDKLNLLTQNIVPDNQTVFKLSENNANLVMKKKNNKYLLYNNNRHLNDKRYDDFGLYDEKSGLLPALRDGKWRILKKTGEEIATVDAVDIFGYDNSGLIKV